MFAAPPEQTLEWSGAGVEGAHRFLRRVWAFAHAQAGRITATTNSSFADLPETHKALRREVHKILQQADHDYQRIQYNTVVSACMKMLNTLEGANLEDSTVSNIVMTEGLSIFLRMLNPITLHITHVRCQSLGFEQVLFPILAAPWPQIERADLSYVEIQMRLLVHAHLRGSASAIQIDHTATIKTESITNHNITKVDE